VSDTSPKSPEVKNDTAPQVVAKSGKRRRGSDVVALEDGYKLMIENGLFKQSLNDHPDSNTHRYLLRKKANVENNDDEIVLNLAKHHS
jgi:hypothetical protein